MSGNLNAIGATQDIVSNSRRVTDEPIPSIKPMTRGVKPSDMYASSAADKTEVAAMEVFPLGCSITERSNALHKKSMLAYHRNSKLHDQLMASYGFPSNTSLTAYRGDIEKQQSLIDMRIDEYAAEKNGLDEEKKACNKLQFDKVQDFLSDKDYQVLPTGRLVSRDPKDHDFSVPMFESPVGNCSLYHVYDYSSDLSDFAVPCDSSNHLLPEFMKQYLSRPEEGECLTDTTLLRELYRKEWTVATPFDRGNIGSLVEPSNYQPQECGVSYNNATAIAEDVHFFTNDYDNPVTPPFTAEVLSSTADAPINGSLLFIAVIAAVGIAQIGYKAFTSYKASNKAAVDVKTANNFKQMVGNAKAKTAEAAEAAEAEAEAEAALAKAEKLESIKLIQTEMMKESTWKAAISKIDNVIIRLLNWFVYAFPFLFTAGQFDKQKEISLEKAEDEYNSRSAEVKKAAAAKRKERMVEAAAQRKDLVDDAVFEMFVKDAVKEVLKSEREGAAEEAVDLIDLMLPSAG